MNLHVRSPDGSDSDSDSDGTIDISELDDFSSCSRWELGCPLQRMVRLDSISLASSDGGPSRGNSISRHSTVQGEECQEEDREHQLKNLYRACMAAELESSEYIDDDSDSDTSSIGWDDVDYEAVTDTLLEVNSTIPEDTYVPIYPSLDSSPSTSTGRFNLTSPALSAPLTLHPITLHSSTTIDHEGGDSGARLLLLYFSLSTPELRADPWNPVPRILRAVDRLSEADPDKTTVFLFHPPLAPLSPENRDFEEGESEGRERPGTVAQWLDFFRQILEGLTFLHECGVAWGGFPSSKSHSTNDLPMLMMDISADPSAITRHPADTGASYSFDRSKYPVKYYFTDFRNAQQVPVSPHSKFQYSAQSQLFAEDVCACGAWIESLLPHLPPLVQSLLPLTRAMGSGTFGADDARKLFEARVRSLAKHVWEQAVKEVGWKLSGEAPALELTAPRVRRAKTIGPTGPKESKRSMLRPPSSEGVNGSVRTAVPMMRSKSNPVPTESKRNDVFGDLNGIPTDFPSRTVASSTQAGKLPHYRSFSAQVGVVKA